MTAVVLDGVVTRQPGDFADRRLADRARADGLRRPCFGSPARHGRPDLRGRRSARRRCARQPSSALRRERSDESSHRRGVRPPGQDLRGRREASSPSRCFRACPPRLRSLRPALARVRVEVPSSSKRPVRQARPGLASRKRPASAYSSRATTPGPGLRSKISRKPLSSTRRRGCVIGEPRDPRGHPQRVSM